MKTKHILASIVLSFCALTASAQFHVGAKGGLSASWITGYLMDGFDRSLPHNSAYLGGTFDYYFPENVMLGVDVLYAGKGHSDRNTATSLKYNHSLGYLLVPVFAGVHFMDGAMSVSAGPQLGVMLFSAIKQEKFTDPANPMTSGRTTDINYDRSFVNPVVFSLFLQFNYMFIDCLGVDVKFDFGMTNTFKPAEVEKQVPGLSLRRNGGRNMSAQIGLCYKFGFGGNWN